MRFGMALKCNVSHERESVQILLAIYIIEQSNAFIYPTTSSCSSYYGLPESFCIIFSELGKGYRSLAYYRFNYRRYF
jgi:hypothetical protein